MKRSFERDIIPMARAEGWSRRAPQIQQYNSSRFFIGLALAPWGAVGGGKFRTDAEEEERRQSGEKGRMVLSTNWERNEDEKKICAALEKVAKEVGTPHITSSEYISVVYSIGTALINRCSCPSILHAKGTVCVPNCRGEET